MKKTAARRRALSPAVISDASARLNLAPARVRDALAAADGLSEEEFELVRKLLDLHEKGIAEERRKRIAEGIAQAIAVLATSDDDVLAEVDRARDPAESVRNLVAVDSEARSVRDAFLAVSVGVDEAARRVGRSRQAVEAMRRDGKALAFRVRNQWRYPEWQFDPDGAGGILRGLPQVLANLGLSPMGAALWLTEAKAALGGAS